jgi:hypothetical protein
MDELLDIVSAESDAVAEPQKKKIIEAFGLFVKAVKAKLVYPTSSKLPQQFKEDLFSRITNLNEELGNLAFKIEADRIIFGGFEVYRAQSKTENFAHVFFRDGILSFQIKTGILFKELETFIDIISRMLRSASVDDDLATLLWESGFEHIAYKLMDDILNIDTLEYGADGLKSRAAPSQSDLQDLFTNEVDLDITDEDFQIPSEERKKKQSSAYLQNDDSISDFIKRAAIYDDSEKAAMAEMLLNDSAFEHKGYIINLLFEILGLETENAGYHEGLELFGKVRDDFIKAGDFASAILILTHIKELQQAFKNLKDLKLDKIQGFIESFASSEKIKIIVEALNNQKDIDHHLVTEYLKMLPWQAITPLVGALGELNHFASRRAICNALSTLAADKVELLARGIEDPRWYVVRNVVMVLGKIKNPRALSYLRRTIQHSDFRVRRETIVSAASIGTEEANEFLIVALNDVDERLQILALKELVARKVIRAYSHIESIVLNKDFKDRSTDQIREFFDAMAILNGEKSFDILKKIIGGLNLFSSEKQKRLKNYAIRSIGHVQNPEARKLLEKIAKSRNSAMADTARRALVRKLKGE